MHHKILLNKTIKLAPYPKTFIYISIKKQLRNIKHPNTEPLNLLNIIYYLQRTIITKPFIPEAAD